MVSIKDEQEVVCALSNGDIAVDLECPLTTPLSGRFLIGRVGLAIVNQHTKFEVSRFTCYEAMNGGAKCRKWGDLGWLGGIQGHGQRHHSIERIRLPVRL